MVRISSFGQQQILLQQLMRNQSSVFEGQQQITTGKKADTFAGLEGSLNTALGARETFNRTLSYSKTTEDVKGKMDTYDIQLEGILEATRAFEQNIRTAIGQDQSGDIVELNKQSFSFIGSALNSKIAGAYIFGGYNSDVPPVNTMEIEDLVALTDVTDAFDNSPDILKARISDNVEVDYGIVANGLGEGIFQVFKDIEEFHQGVDGPIDGNLTDVQVEFLRTKLQEVGDAIANMQQVQTSNGLAGNRIEVISNQHEETKLFMEKFISDVEDVDMTEAISKLNNDQVALEASYRTLSQLGRLTLLDFI